jgi:branched-chain amino acid transport system permease protein
VLALQLLFNALALGAAYALVALGFVLVLNATGAVNFAQGDLVMAGGFGALALGSWLGLPGLALLAPLLLGMAALGLGIALAAYFPIRRRPADTVFISTIAVGIILSNGANALFGPEPQATPPLIAAGEWRLDGLVVPYQSAATILVAAGLIGALHLLFTRTQLGRRLRATAQDREIAACVGIPVDRMVAATFAVGAALAGAAGLLLSRSFFVSPMDGSNYMLKAYVAVTIGGWGSIPGAVLGAVLIAVFEVAYPALPALVPVLAPYGNAFSQVWSTVVLYLLILLILWRRPQGLFGEAVRVRP